MGIEIPEDHKAGCTHMRVKYDPIPHGNECYSECWRCEDCKAQFVPMAYVQAQLTEAREQIESLQKPVTAARCIRHWHDASNDGMIVSGQHVRALWEALADLDRAQSRQEQPK